MSRTDVRPTRRTVVRGAAWSVPVASLAATAPAFAASPCDSIPGVVNWAVTGRYTRTSATGATYTIPDPDGAGPGLPLVLTITNTFLGSNTSLGAEDGTNNNLRTVANVGGATDTSLSLHQSPTQENNMVNTWTGTTNKSITRFSFSRAITNLTFTLRDIDSTDGDFLDGIAIVGETFTPGIVNPSFVTGAGTTTSPFRASGNNTNVGNLSTDGNVTISMATAQSFDLHYWNLEDGASRNVDQDQWVYLSPFSFSYKPCN